MSYDLFDFPFHNNYIVNNNPDIAVVRGTHKHFISLPPFFLTENKKMVQPWSGEHTILDKSISTLKIKTGCLDHPLPTPKHF